LQNVVTNGLSMLLFLPSYRFHGLSWSLGLSIERTTLGSKVDEAASR